MAVARCALPSLVTSGTPSPRARVALRRGEAVLGVDPRGLFSLSFETAELKCFSLRSRMTRITYTEVRNSTGSCPRWAAPVVGPRIDVGEILLDKNEGDVVRGERRS